MTGPVVVVGAGIAGLSTALALAGHGFPVRVFERSPVLGEAGAGIQLSPNALRVLDRLGVLSALRRRSVQATNVELRTLRTGRRLAIVPVRGRDGTPYLSTLRADLQSVLLDAVRAQDSIRVELGKAVSALRRNGDRLVAVMDDGSEHEAPAMIVADGVHSTLATSLDYPAARPTGDVARRLTLSDCDSRPSTITAWLAASRHVVAYPVAAGTRVNVVVVGHTDDTGSFESRDPFLRQVADRLHEATVWPILAVDRRPRASDPSRLLLLGDAAHAMAPFAAQGAALAIEDGYVAAHELATSPDPATAWQRFEAARRQRWDAVRRRVAFHRFVYHLPMPFAIGRDFVLRSRKPETLGRELEWLYDWQPPSKQPHRAHPSEANLSPSPHPPIW